jgi:uncharacterized phage protein (TIGR01671 family)
MLNDVSLCNDDFTNYLNEHIGYLKDKCVLMQYTGLKDKNGVEIYEGDILKISNISILRCEFRNGCFVLVHIKEFAGVENLLWGNLGRLYDAGMNDIFELTEIIGNIYENPELLENK